MPVSSCLCSGADRKEMKSQVTGNWYMCKRHFTGTSSFTEDVFIFLGGGDLVLCFWDLPLNDKYKNSRGESETPHHVSLHAYSVTHLTY